MPTDQTLDPQAVARDLRVTAAVREAMRAGHPALSLLGDIEQLAPKEVAQAFAKLVATVAEVAAEQLEER